LRVLNLSFNDLQDLPPSFFRSMTRLEEVYLSGNKLSSIPTEDLHRLTSLSVLFLNGNRLQTLPQELRKVQTLTVLDVGSNNLKYNINNLEFDWNWSAPALSASVHDVNSLTLLPYFRNFNPNLKYLNFSGNKKLEIKPDPSAHRSTADCDPKSQKM